MSALRNQHPTLFVWVVTIVITASLTTLATAQSGNEANSGEGTAPTAAQEQNQNPCTNFVYMKYGEAKGNYPVSGKQNENDDESEYWQFIYENQSYGASPGDKSANSSAMEIATNCMLLRQAQCTEGSQDVNQASGLTCLEEQMMGHCVTYGGENSVLTENQTEVCERLKEKQDNHFANAPGSEGSSVITQQDLQNQIDELNRTLNDLRNQLDSGGSADRGGEALDDYYYNDLLDDFPEEKMDPEGSAGGGSVPGEGFEGYYDYHNELNDDNMSNPAPDSLPEGQPYYSPRMDQGGSGAQLYYGTPEEFAEMSDSSLGTDSSAPAQTDSANGPPERGSDGRSNSGNGTIYRTQSTESGGVSGFFRSMYDTVIGWFW